MTPETASRLIELNLRFYQEFGKEFSATRRRLQPGVQRLLPQLYPVEALLDLGCGNGELARALARGGFAGRYFGLDFSRPLLRETEGLPPNFSFLEASLTTSDWDQVVPLTGFSIVTAFAVLHHIPSQAFRLMLLRKVWALLVPAGLFIHSEWQFLSSEKWRQTEFNPGAMPA
ncbi:MAG: class I SAM-dependent methyltransferase [Anaerolineales bacterium]|nr:class I SAM-dependent methyltransferase [Anaerolineales bacterium]